MELKRMQELAGIVAKINEDIHYDYSENQNSIETDKDNHFIDKDHIEQLIQELIQHLLEVKVLLHDINEVSTNDRTLNVLSSQLITDYKNFTNDVQHFATKAKSI